jgi:hypothetical protein
LVCACQWLAAKAFDAKSQGTNNFYKFLKLKKMGIQKMSLANIKGKLSRAEMKNIMAGSGDGDTSRCGSACSGTCTTSGGYSGNCHKTVSTGKCYCVAVF